jgi:hypothetical protein
MESSLTEISPLNKAISFIREFKRNNAANNAANKEAVKQAFIANFAPKKQRSIYIAEGYSIRFSESKNKSFSNTILGLAAIQSVDHLPIIICLVRPETVSFMLGNSTFLKKISHSSQSLAINNIRGSFNGTDIMNNYCELENNEDNFDELFAMHQSFSWEENVARLVEATNNIVGINNRFVPDDLQTKTILLSPQKSLQAISSDHFSHLENDLNKIIDEKKEEIIKLSFIDNVNIRGNEIEHLITGKGGNNHNLDDFIVRHPDFNFIVDIKTSLVGRSSAPKAYNIDKALKLLSESNNVFLFCLLSIDQTNNTIIAKLVSIFDITILNCTKIQQHWSGRNSRGTTQLSNNFHNIINKDYQSKIDLQQSVQFLQKIIKGD